MSTMFGALNRFISRLDSESPSQSSRNGSPYGFQVLRNKNLEIAIEPWYDFIIGINGRRVDNPDPNLFATEVRNCAGSNVSLVLWNAKGNRTRTLALPVPTPSPTLGITLQWSPLSVTEDIWHVLDVIPNSPADLAGLLPYGDYIVGTPEGSVHGESGLGELVEDYLNRSLRLYVYNHEYAVTRLVTLTPSRAWGGSGALGCVLGFGALHRLPVPMTEPIAGPGETLFETARFSNDEHRPPSAQLQSQSPSFNMPFSSAAQSSDLFVPTSITSPPPPPSQSATSPLAGPPKGVKKPRAAPASNMTFDDYFREGEQKSKEEDFAPTTKNAAPPPPPPKSAKGPPPVDSSDNTTEKPDEEDQPTQAGENAEMENTNG
ncbi:MAG: hypothetical protein Q9169_002831 [Polycauliona sp. 2 TL-2023]